MSGQSTVYHCNPKQGTPRHVAKRQECDDMATGTCGPMARSVAGHC